jgi:hypothetical protein
MFDRCFVCAFQRRRLGTLYALLYILCSQAEVCFADPKISEITAEIEKNLSQVRSAKITIVTKSSSDIPEGLLFKHSRLVRFSDATSVFAFDGEKRFLETRDSHQFFTDPSVPRPRRRTANGVEDLPQASRLPTIASKSIFDGERLFLQQASSTQVVSMEVFDARPGYIFVLPYLRYASWFIRDPTNSATFEEKRRTEFLPSCISETSYVASQTSRNDETLIVLTGLSDQPNGTRDRIWLDPRLGYMMVKREISSRDSSSRVIARITCSDPLPVIANFYVPKAVVVEEYPPDAALANVGNAKIWLTTTYEANVTDINAVPSELFMPSIQPKSSIVEINSVKKGQAFRSREAQLSADGKLIDEAIGPRASSWRDWLVAANVVAIIILLVVFSRTRWRARRGT